MLYLIGEILIYLIIATSLGLLAGWAVTWTSARQKLVHLSKTLKTQLNDRSNAVKQLKETLQAKIQEVEDLEYELMRRNVDRPEKLIGQGGTDRVHAYEESINEELLRRDQRIAELEEQLNNEQFNGDIVIEQTDLQQALNQRDAIIAELKAALSQQQTSIDVDETEESEGVINNDTVINNVKPSKKFPMRQLEADLQACLNYRKENGETPELRTQINDIKAAILDELKGKRQPQVAH